MLLLCIALKTGGKKQDRGSLVLLNPNNSAVVSPRAEEVPQRHSAAQCRHLRCLRAASIHNQNKSFHRKVK